MDLKTKATLGRITRHIPNRLLDLTRLEIDTSEEDLAKAALKLPGLSVKKKREIAKLLEQGAFRREEIIIDEKKVAELDRYHTREVKKAQRAGLLTDPKMDPFWKKRMEKIKNH